MLGLWETIGFTQVVIYIALKQAGKKKGVIEGFTQVVIYIALKPGQDIVP